MTMQSLNETQRDMTQATGRAAPAVSPNRLIGLGFLVVAMILPFVLDGFTTFQMTMVLIYAIAILGLNLLTGFNGQFSLGHGAFYALGAYVFAILVKHAEVHYLAAIPIAGLASFALGYVFGFPALKLEGIYLALATFALAVATPQILKLSPLEHWTGGVSGIVLRKPHAPFGLPLDQDQWLYFLTLAFCIVLYVLVRNLIAGRTGRAFRAIKDNQIAARSMGIDVTRMKVLAFGYSALITGIAGALSALVVQFVAPDSFNLFLSIGFLVGLVVGGVGWLPGIFAGAAFIMFVPTLAEGISQGLQGVVYGAFLIATIYLAPNGLGGLVTKFTDRLKTR
jgi:branched-chain amino acid transport system permease protein